MQQFEYGGTCGTRWLVAIVAVGILSTTPVLAAPLEGERWIDLGQADSIAIDQPRVGYVLEHAATGEIHGPDQMFTTALLDTGANGVVLALTAYVDFEGGLQTGELVNPDRYTVATRDDGSKVQYSELGVAGTELFDLLEEYDLHFIGFHEDPELHTIEDVRPLGNPNINFGGFSAIVGMPAMINQRTVLDLSTLLEPDEFFHGLPYIQTSFEPLGGLGDGAVADNDYQIEFRMWMPPHSDPMQEGDPTPTFAPMPFVDDVRIGTGDARGTGSFLLDTGAQLTLISEHIAEEAGIVLEMEEDGGDIVDFLQVGGVGGSVMAPIVHIDLLDMPATRQTDEEVVNMRFRDFFVIVLDIGEPLIEEPLDGILGMNLLTSGYAEAVIEMLFGDEIGWEDIDIEDVDSEDLEDLEDLEEADVETKQGFFDYLIFEFTDDNVTTDALGPLATTSNGTGGGFNFRVADEYHHVVPEPGSAGLLAVASALLLMRRRRAA